MRYRKQDSSGDYQFGHSSADFWKDVSEGSVQAIKTRLLLYAGEWFLDLKEGTPWGGFPLNNFVVDQGKILARYPSIELQNSNIKTRVLNTPGVLSIEEYNATFNPNSRLMSINMTVNTIYGQANLEYSKFSDA